jgi:hypothetical protein
MGYSFFLASARSAAITLPITTVTISLDKPTVTGGAATPHVDDIYGTAAGADAYFDARLHEYVWTESTSDERTKALVMATRIIDVLNFKGDKHPVYLLLEDDPYASDEEIREAEQEQLLEFPRGEDTVVPETIDRVCYEIAYALLDGKDPDLELENLGISSQTYGEVSTTYNRDQTLIEHLVNCVPSAQAWNWLKPFLRDGDMLALLRVS